MMSFRTAISHSAIPWKRLSLQAGKNVGSYLFSPSKDILLAPGAPESVCRAISALACFQQCARSALNFMLLQESNLSVSRFLC